MCLSERYTGTCKYFDKELNRLVSAKYWIDPNGDINFIIDEQVVALEEILEYFRGGNRVKRALSGLIRTARLTSLLSS